MAKKESAGRQSMLNAQPRIHQRAAEIQAYGTVSHALPLELEEPVRLEMTEQLNQLLADSMTLAGSLQKVALASCGADVLSVASFIR